MTAPMTVSLSNLAAVPGARKEKVRRGRGIGSGLGKQAGRGGKGHTARAGKGRRIGFEGGQTPLHRRLPKFGFNNPFRMEYEVVNVLSLEGKYSTGDMVDPASLAGHRLVRSADSFVKILGDGSLTKKLTVKAHKFSKSAVQKINQAGGQIEEISLPKYQPEEA